MARNYEQQHLFSENGYIIDCGYSAFATTGATLDITTPLSKIYWAEFMTVCSTADTDPSTGESFYIADTVNSVDGAIHVSGGVVTIGRTGETFFWSDSFGIDDYTANDDLIERSLFTAPFDMVVSQVQWTNAIGVFTGTPLLAVGTTTTDPDEMVNSQAITKTTLVTTTFTIASGVVSDGDKIIALTTGGTGTGPYGASLSILAARTLSSATKIMYKFVGID